MPVNKNKNSRRDTIFRFLAQLESSSFLFAVRRGLALVLPLIITGSLALLLLNLPYPPLHAWMDALFGKDWRSLCQLIEHGSYGIGSLAVLMSISYSYAQQKSNPSTGNESNPIVTTAVCLSCYFVLTAPLDSKIDTGLFSFNGGLPIALLVALTCPPLFLFLTKHNPIKKYLFSAGSDPDFNIALAGIPTGMVTIILFGVVRLLLESADIDNLHQQAQVLFGTPFQGANNNVNTGIGYIGLSQLFWFFGVHGPNILVSVEENILVIASQVNIWDTFQGLEPSYILTKPFIDAFVHIGGSGSTLALIVAILWKSDEISSRRLVVVALLPALFNVNEVILFGLPLVLNPIYLIPFVLAPVIQFILAYAATAVGLVPMTVNDIHWTSPIVLGGYAATGSYAGAILQIFCLFVGLLIYLPFVNLANSVRSWRFRETIDMLGEIAESTAVSPTGKKFIDLPGQTGQITKGLAADLALALDLDDQIFLVYQPLVDMDQGQVAGCEALLRWQHPIHGIIPPHITVALAEDTDLISKLGMQVLSMACCYQKVLQENGQKPSIISVNMSAPQFEEDDLVEKVVTILKDTGIPPQSLKIEITESIALTPEDRPVSALIRLRELGVRVAIDDFGMGHTSLRYLKEFPVDTVKIDRSLTQESADGVSAHIVNSIVNLCEALNVQIIVEGVETIEHIERFKKYHCHLFQGYFFSKPLSGDAYFKYFWETGEEDIRSKLKR